MIFRFLLPVIYIVVTAFFLFGPSGGAGHGSGPAVVYYISMPVSFIFVYLLKGDEYTLLLPITAIGQYFLFGYLIDRFITNSRRKN